MARKKRKARPPQRSAVPQPELKKTSRAQLGADEEQRPYRPRPDDASIEDALEDWRDEEP
jgi:hypothetical protein